ncbi:hypothetical protein DRN58_01060 [Thermococci archaeon]|nr:MAG: hypothetical protein DRN50_06130 [Thermococci archaeon]RLG01777.1 MAG: hypothetical protein DRN58_01060 [Thermococci archaeon]
MQDHIFIAKKIKSISRKEVDFLFSKLNAEEKLKGKRKIFIKPNLFAPEKSKTGATVDFDLISYVVDYLNEIGKKVYIGEVAAHQYDSEKLFRDIGVYDRFNAEFINLNFTEFKEVLFEIKGKKYSFKVPKIVLDCDGIINMPKYKTHAATLLTMAIKNFYGLLPGKEKWRGHALGLNETFYNIQKLFPSDIVITDAYIAMEGLGPTLGVPVKKNLLFASDNAIIHDMAISQILNVKLEYLKFYENMKIDKIYYNEEGEEIDYIDFSLRLPPVTYTRFWYHVNEYFYKFSPSLEKRGIPPRKVLNFLVNDKTIKFWRRLQR